MLVWQLSTREGERSRGQPWVIVPCPSVGSQNRHQQYFPPGLIDWVLIELPASLPPALSSLLMKRSTLDIAVETVVIWIKVKPTHGSGGPCTG